MNPRKAPEQENWHHQDEDDHQKRGPCNHTKKKDHYEKPRANQGKRRKGFQDIPYGLIFHRDPALDKGNRDHIREDGIGQE